MSGDYADLKDDGASTETETQNETPSLAADPDDASGGLSMPSPRVMAIIGLVVVCAVLYWQHSSRSSSQGRETTDDGGETHETDAEPIEVSVPDDEDDPLADDEALMNSLRQTGDVQEASD